MQINIYPFRESLQDCVIVGKVMTPTYKASFTPISKPSLAPFFIYLGVHLDGLLDRDIHVMENRFQQECATKRLFRARALRQETRESTVVASPLGPH